MNSDYTSIEPFSKTNFNKKLLSLFSGAGGLDLGAENTGFETLACVEIDKHCRKTLALNRPKWKLIDNEHGKGDIVGISGEQILENLGLKRGELGVVVGGPPCQSYSNLGLREGVDDKRTGGLVKEFERVVVETYPEGFVFENVEGFNQPKHDEVREAMVEKFKSEGYWVTSGVLVSAWYGDPQIRKRFFILGSRMSQPKLPFPTHFESVRKWEEFCKLHGELASFKPYVTVRDAFEELKSWPVGRKDDLRMGITPIVKERMKLIRPGENFSVLPDEMRPNCWKDGRHKGKDTFGRMWYDKPSVTIRTSAFNPSKGRYIHPTEDRGLSTLEMAILQSFPSDWQFECDGRQSLINIGKMIGNAVPVKLAKAVTTAVALSIFQGGKIGKN